MQHVQQRFGIRGKRVSQSVSRFFRRECRHCTAWCDARINDDCPFSTVHRRRRRAMYLSQDIVGMPGMFSPPLAECLFKPSPLMLLFVTQIESWCASVRVFIKGLNTGYRDDGIAGNRRRITFYSSAIFISFRAVGNLIHPILSIVWPSQQEWLKTHHREWHSNFVRPFFFSMDTHSRFFIHTALLGHPVSLQKYHWKRCITHHTLELH